MILVVECKADEALARAVGLTRRQVEHFLGKDRVCSRLADLRGATGMMDEDPGMTAPSYFQSLEPAASTERSVDLLIDKERDNRVVILCPRLEDWILDAAKKSGLQLTDFGFASDNGILLHAEINERLASLGKLVAALRKKKSERLLYLKSLLAQDKKRLKLSR